MVTRSACFHHTRANGKLSMQLHRMIYPKACKIFARRMLKMASGKSGRVLGISFRAEERIIRHLSELRPEAEWQRILFPKWDVPTPSEVLTTITLEFSGWKISFGETSIGRSMCQRFMSAEWRTSRVLQAAKKRQPIGRGVNSCSGL